MEQDIIMGVMNWLMAGKFGPYVLAFFACMGGLLTIASAIVPFTKTPKDDEIVGKLKALLGRFSLFEPKK